MSYALGMGCPWAGRSCFSPRSSARSCSAAKPRTTPRRRQPRWPCLGRRRRSRSSSTLRRCCWWATTRCCCSPAFLPSSCCWATRAQTRRARSRASTTQSTKHLLRLALFAGERAAVEKAPTWSTTVSSFHCFLELTRRLRRRPRMLRHARLLWLPLTSFYSRHSENTTRTFWEYGQQLQQYSWQSYRSRFYPQTGFRRVGLVLRVRAMQKGEAREK